MNRGIIEPLREYVLVNINNLQKCVQVKSRRKLISVHNYSYRRRNFKVCILENHYSYL